jgi:RNA polymerase sigma factor (sigma-70 family)
VELRICGIDGLAPWWLRLHHAWLQSFADAGRPSPCPFQCAASRISPANQLVLGGLIEKHRPAVKSYALHMTRWANELAEEMVAEGEFHALRGWHAYDRQREFLPWFLKIVRNVVHHRRELGAPEAEGGAKADVLLSSLVDEHPGPATEAELLDSIAKVKDLLDSLPPGLRFPVVEVWLEGRSEAEVARDLHISQPTLSRRLAKAASLLRGRAGQP